MWYEVMYGLGTVALMTWLYCREPTKIKLENITSIIPLLYMYTMAYVMLCTVTSYCTSKSLIWLRQNLSGE